MQKERPKAITRPDEQKTKAKMEVKIKVGAAEEKLTVALRNKVKNNLADKLKSNSAMISEESSREPEDSSESVIEVDPLFIQGIISNLRELDKETKIKYQLTQSGEIFDVEDYIVILVGRHSIQLKNGLPVGLYAPSVFKSARDLTTRKIQIVIHRKQRDNMIDPMQYPYIVVDPDNCLYPTYICSWLECKRKISIEHYIEYNEPANQHMIFGNVIHRYLEWLIRKEVEPQIQTEKQMRRLYESFLYQMFLLDVQFQTFVSRCETGVRNIVQWYQRHVIKGEVIELSKIEKKYLKIEKAIGSEVMIRSKYFGIRGKVDGLFEGVYMDEKNNLKYTVSIPFELKTGSKIMDSHKRQVDFYNLLLRQSKGMPVIGLLYYSESGLLNYRVENPLVCFENINVHRNKIIVNILQLYEKSNVIQLPKLPETFEQCKYCNSTLQCGVARMEVNPLKDLQQIAQNSPEKFHLSIKAQLQALSILQVEYIQKWMKMLHFQEFAEKEVGIKSKSKCLVNKMKMKSCELQKFLAKKADQPLIFKIGKKIANNFVSETLENYFKPGEKVRIFIPMIRVSDGCRIMSTYKNTHYFTMEVEIKNEVKFNRSKAMFLLEENQIVEINVELEKYENSFYNFTRGYVFKFVTQAETWLKSIIIEEDYEEKENEEKIVDSIYLDSLNSDQQCAFTKCVNAERFCLVEGMPGTGKTQLILKLSQYFYSQGKTVLITSFTNQALLNILDRELNREKKIPREHIVREGSKYSVLANLSDLSSQGQDFKCIREYKDYFGMKKVWFVTISSLYIQHILPKFDIVILDEASQCLQPICLEALLKANKFIMIGDEKQLQPVVKSREALKMGMQKSLFERLCNVYRGHKSSLKKQYRMNPCIMNLSNKLVYDDKLELAATSMQDRILKLPETWAKFTPEYLQPLVDPQYPLRFVNYDPALNLFSENDPHSKKVKRYLQIRIVISLYKQFLRLGVDRKDILIISAYNSLVHQLVEALQEEKLIDENEGDVLTIDRSQGTDKEIILFLFYRGNQELMENPRRLNVALTRAKNKFIIIGSKSELDQLAVWTGRLSQLLAKDQINTNKGFVEGLLEE